MPVKTEWTLNDLTIPLAEWNLDDDIHSAILRLESEFNVSLKKDDMTQAFVSLDTYITFLREETDTDNVGYIKVKSKALVVGEDLTEVSRGGKDFERFSTEISQVLFGSNRSEVIRISLVAGLGTPVILPIMYIEEEDYAPPS